MSDKSTMVARLSREGLLPIVKAVAEVQSKRISYRTGIRWCLHGIGGVRLESVKAGGRRMCSIPAVERFFAALDCRNVEPSVTGSSVRHRKDAADSVLDSYGLGRNREENQTGLDSQDQP